MLNKLNKKFLIIFILCSGALAYAYYSQFAKGIEPCPLCIAERIIIAAIGLFSLIFAIHNNLSILNRIYSFFIIGITIFGIKIAAHHIWLMNLPPDQQPQSCGMPLEVLYQRVPLNSFLHTILQGDAECAKVNWTIFGLTGPQSALLLFSIITILALYNLKKSTR